MATIAFVWDSKDLAVWKSDGVRKAVTRALSKAGGDGLRGMRPAASRLIRERKRFKVSAVNKGLALVFPQSKTDLRRLVWTMRASGEAVPLVDLPHRRTKRGVSVEVNRGKRKVVKGAFMAKMKSGHEGIFRRTGMKRLPIREAFTTRPADVLTDPGAADRVLTTGLDRMRATFDRLLPLELAKVK